MSKLIYLASPYTHPDIAVQERRFNEVVDLAGRIMREGFFVYSPIAHCHPIALKNKLPTDWKYWESYLKIFMRRCDELWVATMDGWRKSTGVIAEIKFAHDILIPVNYLEIKSNKWKIKSPEEYEN